MALALVFLVIIAVAGGLVWLARELRASQDALGASLSELQGATTHQLEERDAAVDRRLEALGQTLDRRLGQRRLLGTRLVTGQGPGDRAAGAEDLLHRSRSVRDRTDVPPLGGVRPESWLAEKSPHVAAFGLSCDLTCPVPPGYLPLRRIR